MGLVKFMSINPYNFKVYGFENIESSTGASYAVIDFIGVNLEYDKVRNIKKSDYINKIKDEQATSLLIEYFNEWIKDNNNIISNIPLFVDIEVFNIIAMDLYT
jgi:hypothetical protein